MWGKHKGIEPGITIEDGRRVYNPDHVFTGCAERMIEMGEMPGLTNSVANSVFNIINYAERIFYSIEAAKDPDELNPPRFKSSRKSNSL